jgi:hypothetical protein
MAKAREKWGVYKVRVLQHENTITKLNNKFWKELTRLLFLHYLTILYQLRCLIM